MLYFSKHIKKINIQNMTCIGLIQSLFWSFADDNYAWYSYSRNSLRHHICWKMINQKSTFLINYSQWLFECHGLGSQQTVAMPTVKSTFKMFCQNIECSIMWLYSTGHHTLPGIITHPRMCIIARGRRPSVIIDNWGWIIIYDYFTTGMLLCSIILRGAK